MAEFSSYHKRVVILVTLVTRTKKLDKSAITFFNIKWIIFCFQRQTEHAQLEQKYKQEVEELKRQLSESKVRHLEREEELTGEITSLKKIINDLQDRLGKLTP